MAARLGAWLAVVVAMLALGSAAQAFQIAVPDTPEPTVAELLAAAGVKADDPDALVKRLRELRVEDPHLLDVWIAEAHAREYSGAQAEVSKAWEADVAKRGDKARWLPTFPPGFIDGLVANLKARRLADHARLLDALLRQIGKVGRAQDLEALYEWPNGRTPWGQWKVHAAAEEVIGRCSVEELTAKRFPVPVDVAALLLGDIEPAKAAQLAAMLLKVQDESEKQVPLGTMSIETRTRLAWVLAATDPDQALARLKVGLESHDPASRLAAGLAIASLGDGRIPFRLTAPPEETREARTKWLAGLKPAKPRDYVFPDPFDAPLIKGYTYYTRMDFVWLDAAGKTAREEKDIWPLALDRLPDGTLLCLVYALPHGLTLAGPEGEVFSRFDDGGTRYAGGRFELDVPRGGILSNCEDGRGAVEFGFDGSILWKAMIASNQQAVRYVAPAGRGRFLLVAGPGCLIVDRRGDTVWEVKNNADNRMACMLDADTVLIVEQTCISIHNRQKGLMKKVEGFKSMSWVRYHPERPWIISDSGGMIVYDPATDKKTSAGEHWAENEHGSKSRWAKSGPWPAE